MNYINRGFTLIELLITIAIVAILSSIALPSYISYVQKGRRVDVQHFLLQQAAVLERQYTRLGGYPDSFNIASSDYYSFSYQASTSALATIDTNDSTTFIITSTPISSQSGDSCGEMTINQQGATTPSGSDCWL